MVALIKWLDLILIPHLLTRSPSREREKLSQREGFWQQVEEKARLHPEWKRIGGEMKNTSYSEAEEEQVDGAESTNENDNLTYDRLEQESRDVSVSDD